MKNTIKVHRAQPIRDEDTFGVIYIDRDQKPYADPREYHATDATAMVDVLLATLPGATVDLVLAELMRRKSSRLIVSYNDLDHDDVALAGWADHRCECCGRQATVAIVDIRERIVSKREPVEKFPCGASHYFCRAHERPSKHFDDAGREITE